MGTSYNPKIITNGLILTVDAGNIKSYSGTGTIWTDLTKNKINGTLINSPTYSSANGGSLSLNGTNSYIDCGSTFIANFSSGTTIEVWSKFNTTANFGRLIDINNGASTCVLLLARNAATNKIALEARNSPFTTQGGCYTTNDVISNGTIQHFVATIGSGTVGSAPSSTAKIYVNTVNQSLTQYGTHLPYVPDCSSNRIFWIGRSAFSADAYLNNNIYIIRIYNRELSQSEVIQNYNASKGRFGL